MLCLPSTGEYTAMRRHLLLVPAFACLLASPVPAADIAEDAPSTPTAVTAPSQVAPVAPTEAELEAARVERLQRIELNNRMNAVLEVSLKTLAGLQAVINATTDPATLRDLELRMAQVKRGTTLDLLRVQATFARENGRIAQA